MLYILLPDLSHQQVIVMSTLHHIAELLKNFYFPLAAVHRRPTCSDYHCCDHADGCCIQVHCQLNPIQLPPDALHEVLPNTDHISVTRTPQWSTGHRKDLRAADHYLEHGDFFACADGWPVVGFDFGLQLGS